MRTHVILTATCFASFYSSCATLYVKYVRLLIQHYYTVSTTWWLHSVRTSLVDHKRNSVYSAWTFSIFTSYSNLSLNQNFQKNMSYPFNPNNLSSPIHFQTHDMFKPMTCSSQWHFQANDIFKPMTFSSPLHFQAHDMFKHMTFSSPCHFQAHDIFKPMTFSSSL